MRRIRPIVVVALALLACTGTTPSFCADPAVAGPRPVRDQSGIEIVGLSGSASVVTSADIARLPATQVSVSFETGHGLRHASFEGPLLWTVLVHARVLAPSKPREQAHQTVLITGHDGYTAALAVGEISPAFESKQVILAERMDGQPLAPTHLRIVVPHDRRGARSVRDVMRISINGSKTAPH